MSTVSFIRRCVEAGMDMDTALMAAQAFEAEVQSVLAEYKPKRSKGAERQARYEARKRQKASEGVRNDAERQNDAFPLSPSSLSPTPPNPTTPDPLPPYSPPTPAKSGFEDFWKAYPAKVGKRDAEKKFRLALQRAPLDRIMAGLDAAKRSKRWREGFIPNPATWLNQDRWADEPEGKSGPEPPAQPATPAVIAARLNHFRDTGEWRPAWGPMPREQAA